MITYSIKVCTKLIGTSLISTKHPIYGHNQLTVEQVKNSDATYKNKLFREIESLIKRGIIIVEGDDFKLV